MTSRRWLIKLMKLGGYARKKRNADRTQRGKPEPQHKNYMAWVSRYSK